MVRIWMVGGFILAQCSVAFAQSKPEGGWLEPWKFGLSVIGLIGAAIAFVVGLSQYSRAQQWKRAEFLANEIKDLLADPKAVNALTMIDWGARRIKLIPDDEKRTLVTYPMQCSALQPHTFAASSSSLIETAEGAAVSDEVYRVERAAPRHSSRMPADNHVSADVPTLRTYSPDEGLIRDCYDALLDRLDRLGSYLEKGLMSASDMEPYIGYYVHDIAAPTRNPTEALWCICFLTYVHFYHFSGVPVLFRRFGHDISPEGLIFRGFLAGVVNPPERQLATQLHELAQREWDWTRSHRRPRSTFYNWFHTKR